jgi:ketosteroid isomerase-like protein
MTALLCGEPGTAKDRMAKEISWRLPPSAAAHGYVTSLVGPHEIIGVFAAMSQAAFEPHPTFEIIHAIANDGVAAVLGKMSAKVRTGEPYENLYAFHLRFDGDDRIVELYEFTDTVFATKTFGHLLTSDLMPPATT